ncbi:hypothetical protein PGTUg99_016858 [Puccinia graminis f. sp. tritici]|uniref:HCP-like protein n=1 Tax=Puccinia graminis f. sp. tritici TaxID=56615 RepID=A0A5B0S052_PUCGR|nr:hypothetical protein PGTUg99_016858 [Puccinia graminis f. sp. tritici]
MTEPARQKQLVIDRTLSPLDKLVSQTRTLTSKQSPSSLFINTAPPPPPTTSQHTPNSFSLTPLSTHPNHLAQQQQQQLAPLHNPFNHRNSDASFQSDNSRYSFDHHHHQSVELPSDYHDPHHLASPFDIDSALAQLSNSLRDLDQSAIPDHPPTPLRRPSTGRVNSSTATTQTPREHIPSFYGDQELILPSDHSSHSPPPDLPHTQANHHHHHHTDNSQEVLGTAQPNQTLKDRQTWLSSLSADSESEYDAHESARYPSGHSTSSEDPFQYWQYEASRQSRDLLGSSSKPKPPLPNTAYLNQPIPASSLKPPGQSSSPRNNPNPSEELNPTPDRATKKLSTNFSRPLRPPSVPAPSPLPTPPVSREVSPRDHHPSAEAHQDPEYYSNAEALADTRDILTKTALINASAAEAGVSSSKTGSIRRLGHAARASIQSRSSIDTNSSSGSRRSWKKLFHIGSSAKEGDPTDTDKTPQLTTEPAHRQHSPLPSPSSEHHDPNLPAITFTQSQYERDIYGHHHLPPNQSDRKPTHHQKTRDLQQYSTDQPQVDFQTMGQTSYHQPQEVLRDSNPRSAHRLSIYSLPSCDDPTMEDLEQKERYASRSPLLFDTPGSSQLPSPGVVEERQQQQQRQQKQQQQQTMLQPTARQATFEENQPTRSAAGMPLHSAIAKAKASLAKNGASSGGSKGQTAQDYLQAGIVAHEQGDLERSAGLFERAAREGGGCGAGMLMWGLSLRHGWGCQVHEARAFKWLQKAAESVIEDLDQSALNPTTTTTSSSSNKHLSAKSSASASVDQSKDAVAKSELVLAIYELGQCFLRGWGCKKDKQLAINYFQLAAKLGDPDAQQELGFCYANGKGTKKDLKLAAKYYRMAANQGVEMMGSQWIWKEKYN